MLSVFVADERGLINRVAGVFARRGANIESLAVGLTVDKALFTIIATGTDATVANLAKQIAKLVNVRYVEDITDEAHVERELMLLKVQAPPGPTRTEVTQIADIFRAHAVDVSDRTLTLQVTGDVGKMEAFKKVMTKFGIAELVRTGRISLKRGERMFDTGSWQPRASPRPHTAVEQAPLQSNDGDVYGAGNVLDAAYNTEAAAQKAEPYVLSIEVQDVPGVLNQVTGVFARRGYNVQSLAVGHSEREGISRITMVAPGSDSGISNLIKQLNKLVYVEKVEELTYVPHVSRELMLVKVNCSAQQRGELVSLASIFRALVCDVSVNTITLEVTGKEDKMLALKEVLEPYGILEVARTGRVCMQRDSGVDSKYLGRVTGSRVML
ncbi:acetolactate synthase small subunit chloroplastic-like [Micractinium conductrix]|uniref:Acetolactate synthase small subunit chloroplastic-like n=1 Tax=Micractinium conductrix TaxID=554055 RepID=A0A2P6VIB8_9CHLO|nr:acetolactate synthase small subunit chloroplastic-like [Micractinium conductrix]|eukprot:PSC73807.1 acetolactate synthase small subunit chloroplastic-like [Micractinium conductrix]